MGRHHHITHGRLMLTVLGGLAEFERGLIRARTRFARTVPVRETFHGDPVWEGVVHVFDLDGHPTATRAYAWSSPIDGSEKRRFFAVLQVGAIKTPVDTVRAAIVAEHRSERHRGCPCTTNPKNPRGLP